LKMREARVIKIDEQITVPVPTDQVWKVLSDPHAVVSCIKGAEIVRENDDGTYDGRLKISFGPMRVGFNARVTLDLDEPEMSGRIAARGRDQHGATRMSTEATFVVVPEAGGESSTVSLQGAVTLAGTLAAQMEAGASTVVRRMTTEFSANLIARCAPAVVPAEATAGTAAATLAPAPAATKPSFLSRFTATLRRWLHLTRQP
jgi:uncharacterized protein